MAGFWCFGWGILFVSLRSHVSLWGRRDIFDYILRARVFTVYGQNPFVQTASAFQSDPFFRYGWWTDFPSPYGPLWELTAGLGVRLAGNGVLANIFAFKMISTCFLFATAGVIALTLERLTPERAVSGTLLFLWNPVLLYEAIGNAHNDITMLLWVAASIWAAETRHWKLTVWFLAVGAGFKFIPICSFRQPVCWEWPEYGHPGKVDVLVTGWIGLSGDLGGCLFSFLGWVENTLVY